MIKNDSISQDSHPDNSVQTGFLESFCKPYRQSLYAKSSKGKKHRKTARIFESANSNEGVVLRQAVFSALLVAHNMSGFVARDLSGFIHSFILRVCDEAGRVVTGTKTHAI